MPSSIGFADINVLPLLTSLLFTENAIIESFIKCWMKRSGMWLRMFTFFVDKQSHVTQIVAVWRQKQPLQMFLNSRSTCFGSWPEMFQEISKNQKSEIKNKIPWLFPGLEEYYFSRTISWPVATLCIFKTHQYLLLEGYVHALHLWTQTDLWLLCKCIENWVGGKMT